MVIPKHGERISKIDAYTFDERKTVSVRRI